jgi:hypothetical protein
MRKFITIVTVGVFLAATGSVALADGPDLSIGASSSYVFDVNDPDVAGGVLNQFAYANNGRGEVDGNESFNIDLVQLGVSGGSGDVTYGAKLNMGDLSSSSDDGVEVMTAWAAYDAGTATITAGRIDTPIGYEVLEPWGNANISRSMAWNYQPINHDGLTVSSSTSGLDIMLGVVNGVSVGNDDNDEKGLIGSVSGSAGNVDFSLSGIISEEKDLTDVLLGPSGENGDATVLNLILSSELAGMDVALEYTMSELDADDFSDDIEMNSVVLYAGTDLGNTSLDARLEFANVDYGCDGCDNDVWGLTITAGWELSDNVGFRLEYRHDSSDEDFYLDGDELDDGLDIIQAQLVLTN